MVDSRPDQVIGRRPLSHSDCYTLAQGRTCPGQLSATLASEGNPKKLPQLTSQSSTLIVSPQFSEAKFKRVFGAVTMRRCLWMDVSVSGILKTLSWTYCGRPRAGGSIVEDIIRANLGFRWTYREHENDIGDFLTEVYKVIVLSEAPNDTRMAPLSEILSKDASVHRMAQVRRVVFRSLLVPAVPYPQRTLASESENPQALASSWGLHTIYPLVPVYRPPSLPSDSGIRTVTKQGSLR